MSEGPRRVRRSSSVPATPRASPRPPATGTRTGASSPALASSAPASDIPRRQAWGRGGLVAPRRPEVRFGGGVRDSASFFPTPWVGVDVSLRRALPKSSYLGAGWGRVCWWRAGSSPSRVRDTGAGWRVRVPLRPSETPACRRVAGRARSGVGRASSPPIPPHAHVYALRSRSRPVLPPARPESPLPPR